MEEQKTCTKCGKPLDPNAVVCMYCGRSVNNSSIDYNTIVSQLERGEKKSNITIARVIAFAVLLMNVVTIILSMDNSALRYVCMFTAIICSAVAIFLVVMSFGVSKKSTPEEVAATTNAIMKGAIGVLIFSGADFFVAVSTTMFSPF